MKELNKQLVLPTEKGDLTIFGNRMNGDLDDSSILDGDKEDSLNIDQSNLQDEEYHPQGLSDDESDYMENSKADIRIA